MWSHGGNPERQDIPFFNGYYDDLKRLMDMTLTPGLPPPAIIDSPMVSPRSNTSEDISFSLTSEPKGVSFFIGDTDAQDFRGNGIFYTSTKSWRGYIFTSVCLCVCVSVCVSDVFLLTKFKPN